MTNTTSEFGRELDSLADIISFGIAPSILAYTWGVQFVNSSLSPGSLDQFQRAGTFFAFLFLVCGAARLARFNISEEPAAEESRQTESEIFRGAADSGGGGHGRGGGVRARQLSDHRHRSRRFSG